MKREDDGIGTVRLVRPEGGDTAHKELSRGGHSET